VNQHVAGQNPEILVLRVRVADNDEFHFTTAGGPNDRWS
jgi:hypothetical protein